MTGDGEDLWRPSSTIHLSKLHLKQVAQDHVQIGLGSFMRRILHSLSGQSVSALWHPHRIGFPHVQMESPVIESLELEETFKSIKSNH